MAGRYGMSFAAKMIQEGKYAEAIEEATRAVARDDEDPAPLVDRASAYAWLERYPEAVRISRRRSRSTRRPACSRPTWSTTPTSARCSAPRRLEARTSMEAADATLARYKTVLPGGRHLADAAAWPDPFANGERWRRDPGAK